MFSNHVSDKGLTSRIYQELLKLNSRKPNNHFFKMGIRLELILHQKGKKHTCDRQNNSHLPPSAKDVPQAYEYVVLSSLIRTDSV